MSRYIEYSPVKFKGCHGSLKFENHCSNLQIDFIAGLHQSDSTVCRRACMDTAQSASRQHAATTRLRPKIHGSLMENDNADRYIACRFPRPLNAFCPQIFSHKEHEDLVFGVTSRRRSCAPFFKVKQRCALYLHGFSEAHLYPCTALPNRCHGFAVCDQTMVQTWAKLIRYRTSLSYFANSYHASFTHCAIHILYVVKKHCPEEAHLNRWAKRRLIIKNRQKI